LQLADQKPGSCCLNPAVCRPLRDSHLDRTKTEQLTKNEYSMEFCEIQAERTAQLPAIAPEIRFHFIASPHLREKRR
jgi:hypothetical protein